VPEGGSFADMVALKGKKDIREGIDKIISTLAWGFGRAQRSALVPIVLVIWTLQLSISPVRLRHYCFGPLEWLWRSLTYRKLQPFRRQNPAARGTVQGSARF